MMALRYLVLFVSLVALAAPVIVLIDEYPDVAIVALLFLWFGVLCFNVVNVANWIDDKRKRNVPQP